MKAVLVCLGCLLFMSSCLKKELPVAPHDPGNVLTATVNMDADYKWQVYFNLQTNTIVGKNLKTIWDIGLETSKDGFHVVLNTSKSMFALNTGKQQFSAVSFTDTNGFSAKKHWDNPDGNVDSTAFGDWRSANDVFIVDRGFNEKGQSLGWTKIQLLSVTDSSFQVRYGALNGSTDTTLTVAKDSTYNFAFLSFDNGIVQVEPPKAAWDLVFTQYTHIYTDLGNMPYLVTGCLLNRYNTLAAADSVSGFAAISYNSLGNYTLTPAINTIGFLWKTFNGSTYTVNVNHSYIIKDQKGYFYRLHFIDFYDNTGVKGNPKWEYQQL